MKRKCGFCGTDVYIKRRVNLQGSVSYSYKARCKHWRW